MDFNENCGFHCIHDLSGRPKAQGPSSGARLICCGGSDATGASATAPDNSVALARRTRRRDVTGVQGGSASGSEARSQGQKPCCSKFWIDLASF
jgi:hypothetical protein